METRNIEGQRIDSGRENRAKGGNRVSGGRIVVTSVREYRGGVLGGRRDKLEEE